MNLLWLVIIILVVAALLGAPGIAWQHSYGYGPSGGIGLVVLILIVLLLLGKI